MEDLYKIKKSNRKNKKYMVLVKGKTGKPKTIHFGDTRYEHFEDTALGLYKNLNHYDMKRRERYLKRAKGIKDKEGKLTWKDKNSPNYYSVKFLWRG